MEVVSYQRVVTGQGIRVPLCERRKPSEDFFSQTLPRRLRDVPAQQVPTRGFTRTQANRSKVSMVETFMCALPPCDRLYTGP